MNKAQKIAASAALVEGVASELQVEAASAEVIAKTKVSKAAKQAADKAPKAPKAPKEKSPVSARELAVMEVIKASEFQDPDSKQVPSYVVAMEAEAKQIEAKAIPGIIASLNKKGLLVGQKVKGMYQVGLTAAALALIKA